MQYRKVWIAFGLVNLISFTVPASVGYKAISNGPPIPSSLVTADRWVLFTGETIEYLAWLRSCVEVDSTFPLFGGFR